MGGFERGHPLGKPGHPGRFALDPLDAIGRRFRGRRPFGLARLPDELRERDRVLVRRLVEERARRVLVVELRRARLRLVRFDLGRRERPSLRGLRRSGVPPVAPAGSRVDDRLRRCTCELLVRAPGSAAVKSAVDVSTASRIARRETLVGFAVLVRRPRFPLPALLRRLLEHREIARFRRGVFRRDDFRLRPRWRDCVGLHALPSLLLAREKGAEQTKRPRSIAACVQQQIAALSRSARVRRPRTVPGGTASDAS
jgi:hypothetical protein